MRAPHAGRLTVVDWVRIADDEAALAAVAAPAFAPRGEAIVTPGPDARALAGTGATGRCAYAAFAADEVAIDCQVAGGQAFLLMAEAHARGWQARVDGHAAPLVRADVALRGLYLTPGSHRIELRYMTPGLRLGLALSALGLLLCALAAVVGRVPRPTPTPVERPDGAA